MSDKLTFSKGNSKLDKQTGIFSLPAGHSCPGALTCLAKVEVDKNGKRTLIDGDQATIRCFAATAEALYSNVHESRKRNLDFILDLIKARKSAQEIADVILENIKAAKLDKVAKFRVHESGDYVRFKYFEAWMLVAKAMPDTKFYSYTKSIPFLVRGIQNDIIPNNFSFTASKGGKFDHLIDQYDLKSASIVLSEKEAADQGLPIDHDDSNAVDQDKGSFALLIHGVQKAGSDSSKALQLLKSKGKGGYSNKNKKAA